MTTYLYFYELTTNHTNNIEWKKVDNTKPVVELAHGMVNSVTAEQVNYLREIIINS